MDSTKLLLILSALIVILLIICVGLLIIVLKKNNSKEYESILSSEKATREHLSKTASEITASVRDEFSRSRVENANAQSQQRKELSESIKDMTDRLSKMTTDNYEFNVKMADMISVRLLDMRKSNEEKLEQMRLTVDEKLNETLTKRLDMSFKTVSDM